MPVTFGDDEGITSPSGSSLDQSIDFHVGDQRDNTDMSERIVSTEFKEMYGVSLRSKDTFNYTVVDRLSRWEGGSSSPYDNSGRNGNEATKNRVHGEKMTIGEFLSNFVSPTYDFTEVTIEDIERVKIMHGRFLGDAQFSFNYSTLLIIASVIAGIGLGSNSSASIIASMLVSP